MSDKYQDTHNQHRHHEHDDRGKSSFDLLDSNFIFNKLKLKQGDSFLDLGCGPGDYVLEAAKIVGNSGEVYALDQWEEGIEMLRKKAASQGLKNIKYIISDIAEPLNITDNSVDVCFIAMVLHGLNLTKDSSSIFNEIHRVLKQTGCLVIIEFHKVDQAFGYGPQLNIRLSPEEVEQLIAEYGFKKLDAVNIGEYSYLIIFGVKK